MTGICALTRSVMVWSRKSYTSGALCRNGSASVTTAFLKERPADAKKYIAAYARAVDFVRKNPTEVRRHIDGFTAIDESLVKEVPLSGFTMYDEFSASDIGYFQKFFDVFAERKIFSRRIDVKSLLYVA